VPPKLPILAMTPSITTTVCDETTFSLVIGMTFTFTKAVDSASAEFQTKKVKKMRLQLCASKAPTVRATFGSIRNPSVQ
jgi:hypothetical protein